MFDNKLKRTLKSGEAAFGTFVTCNSPDMVEILALSGFDFIVIDTEHGPLSVESTINLIRAAELRGMTPITRVTENTQTKILRSLDVGAHGVQVPQVNNKSDAEKVVEYSKYFPLGNRGVALPRAADFATVAPLEYFKTNNAESLIVVHCENKIGLENIEEIASVPEVDVIFLGPFDMSQSLGIPGQVTHPLVEDAAQRVLDACKKYNKAAGILAMSGKQAIQRVDQGFQYVPIGLDITLMANAFKYEISKAKGL